MSDGVCDSITVDVAVRYSTASLKVAGRCNIGVRQSQSPRSGTLVLNTFAIHYRIPIPPHGSNPWGPVRNRPLDRWDTLELGAT